jgi:hypothetical protein
MRLLIANAIAVLLSLVVTVAPAAEVLDQSNDTSPSGFADSTSGSYQEQAQLFTVDVNGTLSRVAVQIVFPGFGVGGSAILTVYSMSGGVPNASLGTASISNAGMPSGGYAYQSFDVSSYAIPVHVGDVLAYGVTSTTDSYFLLRSTGDHSTYAGGQEFWRVRNPTGSWIAYSPTRDLGFQTYVLAAAGLPGDFNNDGTVTAADYVTWRKYLGAPTEAALNGHGDNQNGVDQGDYSLWRAHFGASTGSGSIVNASIPEPGAALLSIVAIALISTCDSRRSAARTRRSGRSSRSGRTICLLRE